MISSAFGPKLPIMAVLVNAWSRANRTLWVDQRNHNPRVGGSSPSPATIYKINYFNNLHGIKFESMYQNVVFRCTKTALKLAPIYCCESGKLAMGGGPTMFNSVKTVRMSE